VELWAYALGAAFSLREKTTMNSINATAQAARGRHSAHPRFVLFAGFPGSGKTAAVAKFGAYLKEKGLNVGVITNDHGQAMVDGAILRSHGFEAEEIQGGCFSRQPGALVRTADRMADSVELDAFIAEAVGTCTNLDMAFSYPAQLANGKALTNSPLSVLVDPVRASRIFDLDGGGNFSDKIAYIYSRQLEEAEFIVINKVDLISESRLETLSSLLKKNHPHAQIFPVSVRTAKGLSEWFDCLMRHEHKKRDGMIINSERSAEGEAAFGWLNCTIQLSSIKYWESNPVLIELAGCIQNLLRSEAGDLAHLKIALIPDEDIGGIAAINLVRIDSSPEISQQLSEPIQSGELVLNLRAEADPELLHATLNRAILVLVDKHPDLFARLEHCEHFRPGKRRSAEPVADLV